MNKFVTLAVALMLTACGQVHQTDVIKGNDGKDGISMGIDVKPATTCTAGGTTLKTFVDDNANGELDIGESIKKTATICNGTNGLPGTSVTVDIALNTECAKGGIVVTLGSNKSYVCNGADGSMGPQGATGAQGPAGVAGKSAYELWTAIAGNENKSVDDFFDSLVGATGLSAYQVWLTLPGNAGKTEAQFISSLTGPDGTNGSNGSNGAAGASAYDIWRSLGNTGSQADFIASLKGSAGSPGATGPQGPQGVSGSIGNLTPVQLCPGDTNTSYPEYGFIVGTNLYAVYFDKNQPIAFLSKLNTGNYVTTNGSNCYFTYANNGSTITLTNSNNTSLVTTVNLNSSSPTPVTSTLAGSCSVVKYADHSSEQQFHFVVSGMVNYLSYTLEITYGNASSITGFGDTNGGATQYVSPLWTIAPQNSATGFDFYAKHGSNTVNKPYVVSAKVKKGGQELNCSVQN